LHEHENKVLTRKTAHEFIQLQTQWITFPVLLLRFVLLYFLAC
jgi:hypothetical protein